MSVELKRCENCGEERNVLATGFCTPCEMAIQAVEPPQYLKDLRAVYNGHRMNAAQHALGDLLRDKPREFLIQLRAAEREYRQEVRERKKEKSTDSVSTEPPGSDEGTARVEELIDRILKEANNAQG